MKKETVLLYLILWTKISVLNAEELHKEIPASLLQKKDLALSVCSDLIKNESYSNVSTKEREDRKICENNFLSHYHISKKPPKVTIRERTSYKVSFTVTPSKHTQIVALLNEHSNDEIIYYSLIKNNEKPNAIYPDPEENYTFWSAALSPTGTPSLWRRGPALQSWKQYHVEKQYDIKFKFLMDSYKNDSYYIPGQFSWNSSDPTDSDFRVINNCVKEIQGNMYNKRIGPNRTVVLQRLPLNDTCTIRVKGKYGMTNVTYRTPAYENVSLCEPPPEIPSNLSTEALQEGNSNLWSVRVRWAKPRRAPHDYNVTLRAHTIHSRNVTGNVTEVKFKNVKGEGMYIVSVVARVPGRPPAVATLRSIFPARVTTPGSTGLMMGASWAAALLTVSALLMIILYVRRRLATKRCANIYYPGILEKTPEDIDKDTGSPESGSEDHWEIRPDRLLLHEIIGEGAFGVVRRGTLAPANKNVAIKMLKDFPSLEEIRSFRAEMELMKSVGAHPHVVSLVGCCSGRRPLIVAEYCSRGDLLSYLRCSWDLMLSRRNVKYYNNNKESINYRNDLFKNKPDSRFVANRLYEFEEVCDTELTLLDLLSFCRQIAMGMEFLASNRVIHRDLAARNVLVTADRTLKIADFGLSRDVYQENQYKQKSNGKMPVKWMALESLTHRIYTTQTDVWSFGVVMWEVVTLGGAPYAGVSAARLPRLLAAGYRMPRPQNCSASLYQLMLACWNDRPRSRPTFSELHATLDELLCASADHYLSLTLPAFVPDDVAPDAPLSRYVRNLMRGKWRNGKMYERPLTAPTNHYTAQPSPLIQT
ncbi:tyrosine-protein kinase receptor torso-like [Maniola jurtina]|uniref:tyrosine-protein kinase receptor torso-like n=1 Tax=Maniola jurtina TaxID=191418 RepID=UPI001E6877FE|nr:tyrosine-protein kinase receptor torso-like [Maniola jurtina]